jgi:hypothetical protein
MLFLFTALLVLAAGVAGFLAGVKHAAKGQAIKDLLKK